MMSISSALIRQLVRVLLRCVLRFLAAAAAVAPALGGAQAAGASDAAAALDKYLLQPNLRYDGAAVVVVESGQVVFSKGYGFSDGARRQRPVDPASTRFEIASITKTFVGTRIAQLIENGVIASVDDPVNKYLKGWQLPDNDGKAITIRHLLTHQAGFEEAALHDFAPGAALPEPDAAYFRSKLPRFVGPAGRVSNYSNYGLGVLGRMVADVTSKPTSDALAEGIWRPAGMSSTESKVKLGPYPGRIVASAFYPDGSRVELPSSGTSDPIITSGAGNTLSTAQDMGRYMLGLLGGSQALGVPSLVGDQTRAWMFSRLGQNDPLSQAYGAAFMVNRWNGELVVEHGGRALAAQSVMLLLPERKIGVFVTISGEGGAPSASDLALQLIGKGRMVAPAGAERFRTPNLFTLRAPPLVAMLDWPKAPQTSGTSPLPVVPLAAYSGSYESERRLDASRQKWVDWFIKGSVTSVAPDGKGGLRVGWAEGYKPIAPDVFWREPTRDPKRLLGWNELVVFERGPSGAVDRLWFGYTDATYGRMVPARTPAAVLGWLQWGALGMLLGLLAHFWRRGTPGKRLALVMPLLLIMLPVGFFGFWPDVLPAPYSILYLEPRHLAPFVLVGNAIGVLALWLAWRLFAPQPEGTSRLRRALQLTSGALVSAGALAMTWGLTQLNGMGWPF
jgi:CubicO group peptidase (beta-lactamase class C family)